MNLVLHSSYGSERLPRWRQARLVAFRKLLGSVSPVDDYDRYSWHYWVEQNRHPVSCARVVRQAIDHLPSGHYFTEREIELPPGPYAEPSRFGGINRRAFLMATGSAAYDGYLLGEYWILTAREILLQSLATYPFHIFGMLDSREMYGGPATREPIWLVGVNPGQSLGSVLALEPHNFPVLFPHVDPADVANIPELPSAAEFSELAASNVEKRRLDKEKWSQMIP